MRKGSAGVGLLETEHGIATCEKANNYSYQWDYPNGWACLQYAAINRLLAYGYPETAKRLATKYVNLITTKRLRPSGRPVGKL